jgi:RNA methyltransferase, TrmH family
MLSKIRIKQIQSLRLKKFRDTEQKFIAEGHKLVSDLLLSNMVFDSIYATADWLDEDHKTLHHSSTECIEVSEKELGAISSLTTPNQVVSIINIPQRKFDNSIFTEDFVLMLDEIKDPGNMGTIIRTADWFGINHIICSHNCVEVYNPKVVQATMGSIARVHIFYEDLKDVLSNLNPSINVYGTFLEGSPLTKIRFKKNGVIIIGNESKGISSNIEKLISEKIYISPFFLRNDISSGPESLNASIAAGIVLFAARNYCS